MLERGVRAVRIFIIDLLDRLVFALATFCAGAGLIAHLGRYERALDLFAQFAPFWLAGSVAALLLGLPFRGHSRIQIGAIALVGILASGHLMAPEYRRDLGPKAPASARDQLKVIQFNVWRDNVDPAATADWIAAQNADIVMIEENNLQVREMIAERTGMTATCFECGVTIFSRQPPVRTNGDRDLGPMVHATFRDGRGEFDAIAVHYAWPTDGEDQQRQEDRLARTLAGVDKARALVGGDMNSAPWSYLRQGWDAEFGLIRRDRALFTWPAAHYRRLRWLGLFPFLPIDHVYAGDGWATVSVKRGPRLGSDHYPVIMILAPRAPH